VVVPDAWLHATLIDMMAGVPSSSAQRSTVITASLIEVSRPRASGVRASAEDGAR
jgi:hypothetical protein